MTTTARPIEETEIQVANPLARVWAQTFLGLIVPFVLLIVGYWSVRNVDASKSGPLGIIDLMPGTYFAVVALLGVSFVLNLRLKYTKSIVLVAHVFVLICLFHGIISWIEQSPRFPVTYTHLGFIEYIQRTNHALPSLDARMSWPSFFAMGAMLDKVAGLKDSYSILLWVPLLFNLCYSPLIFSLARTITTDRRVQWLTVWLYFSIEWIGQDYYSPQGINFILFLTFMTVLLHCFRTDRAPLPRPLRGIGLRINALVQKVLRTGPLRPGNAPILPTASWQRALLVGALLLMYCASVISHQITPVFILLEVIILVILRRIALRGFPLLMAVIMFSYISYGAIGFWSGHFSDIFGGFGQVGAVAQQNVGSKVQGNSTHTLVIYARLALAASLWGAAILGILRRLRKGRTDIFVMVGFFAPFLVLGGQSYGGEAILRVFLFGLPFASTLAVLALLPVETLKFNGQRMLIAVVVASLLGPAFILTRFGNEQFEYVSKNEYLADQKLSDIAPAGSEIVGIAGNSTWAIQNDDKYNFHTATNLAPFNDPDKVYETVASYGTRSTYLFIERSQYESVSIDNNMPRDWYIGFEQMLTNSGRFQLVYQNPDAAIFAPVKAPGAKQ